MKKSDTILKLPCKSVYTKPSLCLSATKLLKFVYSPLNVSFLKALVVNLSFALQILTSRKEKELSYSVLNKNSTFLCIFFLCLTNRETCSGFSRNTKHSSTYLIFYTGLNNFEHSIEKCLPKLDVMESPWLLHQFDSNTFDQIKNRFLW